ncbi:hypothetical protein BT96DRAFT_1012783 [Gymnopus androsaceus JB14]|uniref:FAM86 N-terminal domain-containing protein n=1 Tax=Gymnopus androsaceus JB14 TaxID=1447944 RepID=A0A6A4IF17_9AGAR|nr:hypothetical protein BT96DRAFT_1012783 [Gymnopus androsaceus JB14]
MNAATITIDLELFTLLRDYAALINRFVVDCILLNPHFQKYPPSKQYERAFYKTVIAKLEDALANSDDEEEEIDPRILGHYLSILPPSGLLSGSSGAALRDQICDRGLPLVEVPSKSFLTHFWKPYSSQAAPPSNPVNLADYQSSTLEESRTTIESGTTGLRTWFASHVMARYLIQNRDIIEGKRVLELGSGVGFLGIIAASLQQLSSRNTPSTSPSIWLTDANEEVLTLCRRNVQLPCNLSSTHQSVHFRVLDWEEALQPDVALLKAILQDEINPDVILGADIVFDPTLVPSLVALIALSLRPGLERGT